MQFAAGALGGGHDRLRVARDIAHEHVHLPESDAGSRLVEAFTAFAARYFARRAFESVSWPSFAGALSSPASSSRLSRALLDDQHVRAGLLHRLRALLREQLGHRLAEIGRRLHGARAGLVERAVLVRRGALAARDDGARMAHAFAGRRGHAGDVRDDRLGDVLADEIRGGFFIGAADLADHDDAFGLRIALKELQHVDEVHAAHRIAADADAGALAEALVSRLEHGLVGQRARARHDADAALLVDEARHDADLAFARRDDARAVRPDETRARAGERRLDAHHVVDRDAFGDAHHELDAGVGRFEDRIGRERRGHVDDAGGRAGFLHGIGHGVEHRQVEMFLTAAARRDAADHLRAVLDALFAVKRALLAGEALADHARVLVDENAHVINVRWRRGRRPSSPHR